MARIATPIWAMVLIVLTACGATSTTTDAPVVPVEPDEAVIGDIEVSLDDQRRMYAAVVDAVCAETPCFPPTVVINDFGGDPGTTGRVLPPIVLEVLNQTLGTVNLIHPEMFRGNSALLFGPIRQLREDLVSINAGYLCGNMCGSGHEHFFLLQGDRWRSVTAKEAGVEFESIWSA